MDRGRIGIIGGSGLYALGFVQPRERVYVPTPFGDPSDRLDLFSFDGREVAFLPRHGSTHRLLPTEINYRANLWALKKLGVERVVSVSAVGSFKREIQPTDLVLVDQFYDRTNQARPCTFFGNGVVAHVSLETPVCDDLRRVLFESGQEEGLGARMHWGGTYLNIEGPAFSTRAESGVHKSWGFDVVGMTNMLEARLAREAELCYATLAMVTDYDSWVDDQDKDLVQAEHVIANTEKSVESVRKILGRALRVLPAERRCRCGSSLSKAIVTPLDKVPPASLDPLHLILGKYLRS